MGAQIQVSAKLDPADLAALGQAAKSASAVLQRELLAGLKKATKPLGQRMIQEVATGIPRGGGLAYRVAGAAPTVTASAGGGGAEVAINFRKPRVLGAIERGEIPHPVYGRVDRPRGTWTWVTQPIEPGLVTRSFERNSGMTDAAMLRVMDDVARKLGFQ